MFVALQPASTAVPAVAETGGASGGGGGHCGPSAAAWAGMTGLGRREVRREESLAVFAALQPASTAVPAAEEMAARGVAEVGTAARQPAALAGMRDPARRAAQKEAERVALPALLPECSEAARVA